MDDDADGSVTVTVAAGEGYAVGGPTLGAVLVEDDDLSPPVVSIVAKATLVTSAAGTIFSRPDGSG